MTAVLKILLKHINKRSNALWQKVSCRDSPTREDKLFLVLCFSIRTLSELKINYQVSSVVFYTATIFLSIYITVSEIGSQRKFGFFTIRYTNGKSVVPC